MYNGHKRVHVIKSQSIANLSGPYEDKRHDSAMLSYESDVLPNLRRVAFNFTTKSHSVFIVTQRILWEFTYKIEITSLLFG